MAHDRLTVALVSLAIAACVADPIQQSHIDGNVPAPADFHRLLQRDLDAYFRGKGSSVRYEMLRDGPTQSGVAYPKFYAWVSITPSTSGSPLEGAVRLAAIDKLKFEVTEFYSTDAMRSSPEQIYAVFPRPVAEKIKVRLGVR